MNRADSLKALAGLGLLPSALEAEDTNDESADQLPDIGADRGRGMAWASTGHSHINTGTFRDMKGAYFERPNGVRQKFGVREVELRQETVDVTRPGDTYRRVEAGPSVCEIEGILTDGGREVFSLGNRGTVVIKHDGRELVIPAEVTSLSAAVGDVDSVKFHGHGPQWRA